MKRSISIAIVFAVALLAVSNLRAADKAPGDALLGKWWFPKKNGKLEVRRENGIYFGKIVAYDKEGALDKYNPDESSRKRPVLGIDMLKDFTYDPAKKQWAEGTIYDGDSGKTYNCTLWFENGDANQLSARGYVGISLFGRTEIFTRVTEQDEKAGGGAPGNAGK